MSEFMKRTSFNKMSIYLRDKLGGMINCSSSGRIRQFNVDSHQTDMFTAISSSQVKRGIHKVARVVNWRSSYLWLCLILHALDLFSFLLQVKMTIKEISGIATTVFVKPVFL